MHFKTSCAALALSVASVALGANDDPFTQSVRTTPHRAPTEEATSFKLPPGFTITLVTAEPRVPIVANVDAEPKRTAASAVEALVAQVSSPVRWEDVVRRLASEGATTYVEVGPGSVLSGLVRKIHRDATVMTFGTPDDLAQIEALRS